MLCLALRNLFYVPCELEPNWSTWTNISLRVIFNNWFHLVISIKPITLIFKSHIQARFLKLFSSRTIGCWQCPRLGIHNCSGCAGNVVDIRIECEIGELNSNSVLIYCFHFHTEILRKGMSHFFSQLGVFLLRYLLVCDTEVLHLYWVMTSLLAVTAKQGKSILPMWLDSLSKRGLFGSSVNRTDVRIFGLSTNQTCAYLFGLVLTEPLYFCLTQVKQTCVYLLICMQIDTA